MQCLVIVVVICLPFEELLLDVLDDDGFSESAHDTLSVDVKLNTTPLGYISEYRLSLFAIADDRFDLAQCGRRRLMPPATSLIRDKEIIERLLDVF